MGANATISWDKVDSKPTNLATTDQIPNEEKITQITKNTVTTSYVNALNVTAKSIDVDSLSAISANMGTVNAGILRSKNANCEGTNIAAFTGLTINLTNPSICGPGFKIDSTGGQFSGSLSGANITGATGTFSGSLNVGNYFSVDANNKTFRAGGLSVAANGSTTVEGAIKATSLTITSTAAASAGLATSNELSNVSNIANNASATANNVSTIANNAYNVANNASATANNASSVANNVSTIANNAYNVANNASNVANNASATANSAYGQANTAYNVANNASTTANTAYGQANTAYNVANSAYGQANTATTIANNASNVANAAQGAANNAYNIANTATNQINAWKTGNTKLTGTTEISGGNITADHLSISAITSPNCTVVNGYTNEGSHFDLINGTIHTPGFYTTPEGDAHFKGSIESNSGKIAKWDISQDSISKGDVALIATDTQPFDYKLGSESKSSYIRFKAGTERVQRIESEVLQVNYNADGYIIIGDETQYSKTTCVYRSQKNNQYLSKIYTSIPDYTVNFEYQSSPWHYYKLTSSKSYVTHTVYLTVFYEYSTYDEWPTHCILKDGTVFLQATHFGAPTQGMILEEVGYGVKLRPNLSDLVSWDENPGTKTGIFLLNHSQIANGSYINVRSNTDATSMIHDGIYFQSSSGAYTKAWITSKALTGQQPTGKLYFNNIEYTSSSISDAHLKHSIELLPQIYETFFDKLQPTRYKYIDGTSNRYHTGFIAQQVVASLEDSGLTTQDFAAVVLQDPGTEREFWQLRRDEFVALNTWQIQKLKTRMVESETKVELLEAEILSLKTELQNLKNK